LNVSTVLGYCNKFYNVSDELGELCDRCYYHIQPLLHLTFPFCKKHTAKTRDITQSQTGGVLGAVPSAAVYGVPY